MELTERISAILEEKYQSDPFFADCFTVDIAVQPGNKLLVYVDSDSVMDFDKCQKISRHLEGFLDEHQWLGNKYVLEVSSPGVGRPLKFLRQYRKNIGRLLEVTLHNQEKETGILKSAEEDHIVLEMEQTEKEGKKKIRKIVDKPLPLSEISKAIVKITFK